MLSTNSATKSVLGSVSLSEQQKATHFLHAVRAWIVRFAQLPNRNITIIQLAILVICYSESARPSASTLAELLERDPKIVIKEIRCLIEIGLLFKESNTRLSAKHTVILSDYGKDLMAQAYIAYAKMITARKRLKSIAPIDHIGHRALCAL